MGNYNQEQKEEFLKWLIKLEVDNIKNKKSDKEIVEDIKDYIMNIKPKEVKNEN